MKVIFFLFLFLLLYSCSYKKGSYWCGDHPCINKKEQKAYFEKNMTVEFRKYKKDDSKKSSEIEKITKQAKIEQKRKNIEEKSLKNKEKLKKKMELKEKKELAKQAKLEEKRRIKNEKELAKQNRLEEKRRIQNEKNLAKKIEMDEKKIDKPLNNIENSKIYISKDNSSDFNNIAKRIIEKNISKPYPDINFIQD